MGEAAATHQFSDGRRVHILTVRCWCKPTVDGNKVIHNDSNAGAPS